MRAPTIFREAARLVEMGDVDHACNAIYQAATGQPGCFNTRKREEHPEVMFFNDLFKPVLALAKHPYFSSGEPIADRNARVVALCLAAVIATQGGL